MNGWSDRAIVGHPGVLFPFVGADGFNDWAKHRQTVVVGFVGGHAIPRDDTGSTGDSAQHVRVQGEHHVPVRVRNQHQVGSRNRRAGDGDYGVSRVIVAIGSRRHVVSRWGQADGVIAGGVRGGGGEERSGVGHRAKFEIDLRAQDAGRAADNFTGDDLRRQRAEGGGDGVGSRDVTECVAARDDRAGVADAVHQYVHDSVAERRGDGESGAVAFVNGNRARARGDGAVATRRDSDGVLGGGNQSGDFGSGKSLVKDLQRGHRTVEAPVLVFATGIVPGTPTDQHQPSSVYAEGGAGAVRGSVGEAIHVDDFSGAVIGDGDIVPRIGTRHGLEVDVVANAPVHVGPVGGVVEYGRLGVSVGTSGPLRVGVFASWLGGAAVEERRYGPGIIAGKGGRCGSCRRQRAPVGCTAGSLLELDRFLSQNELHIRSGAAAEFVERAPDRANVGPTGQIGANCQRGRLEVHQQVGIVIGIRPKLHVLARDRGSAGNGERSRN